MIDPEGQILDALWEDGHEGLTWAELGVALGLHHKQVSDVLAKLHQQGAVFMLRKRHNRSHPYVHVKYRDFYTEQEVHDAPKTSKAGQRRAVLDDLVAVCRAGLVDGFEFSRVRELLNRLDELA